MNEKEKDERDRADRDARAHAARDKDRAALHADARLRKADQRAEMRYVSPFDDPEGLLTDPKADPIINSTALVIPPATIDETLLPEEEEPVLPGGEPVPDVRTLSGKQQELVEVLTGKRLQRDEAHITPKRERPMAPGRKPIVARPGATPLPA